MPTYAISFTGNINNDSLQVGDYAYALNFVTFTQTGGFNQTVQSPILLGIVTGITINSININDDTVGDASGLGPNDFIAFAKDSKVNLSGLVGYYAEAKFKNNSQQKAEMYSVGSEITPSSK